MNLENCETGRSMKQRIKKETERKRERSERKK